MKKFLLISIILITLLITVSCTEPELQGEVYFFSVALNYNNISDNRANSLAGTKNDQENWVKEIEYISHGKAHITTISDFDGEIVTKERIENAIDSLDLKEDDVFIFHYSGHGYYNGALCIEKLSGSNWVLDFFKPEDLLAAIGDLNCNRVMLMDCCFGGAYVPDSSLCDGLIYNGGSEIDTLTDGMKIQMNETYVKSSFLACLGNAIDNYTENNYSQKLWVISASTDKQQAAEDITKHGGYLSMFCLDYFGYDWDTKTPNYVEGRDYTVYGMFDHYRTYQRSNSAYSSNLYCYTPQVNYKPVDLVLFRT